MNVYSVLLVCFVSAASVSAGSVFNGGVVVRGRNASLSEDGIQGRAWRVDYWPATGPKRIMLAGGVAVQGSGNVQEGQSVSGQGSVDAAAAWFNTLAACDVGFAYFSAEGNFAAQKNAVTGVSDGDNGTASVQAEGTLDAAAFGLGLLLGHLFEYNDTNSNDVYDHGVDNITGWYHLRYLFREWTPGITCSSVDQDGVQAKSCLMNTTDGVFSMRLTATDNFAVINEIDLTPQKVKIDIGVNWFNNSAVPRCDINATPLICGLKDYHGPSLAATYPNAKLGLTALAIGASASGSLNAQYKQGVGAVQIQSAAGSQGVFEWLEVAQVSKNGKTTDEAVNVAEFDECPADYRYAQQVNDILTREKAKPHVGYAKFLIISFAGARPDSIVWDPTIGAEGPPQEPTDETAVNGSKGKKCIAAASSVDVLGTDGVVRSVRAGDLRAGDLVRSLSDDGAHVQWSPVVHNVHAKHAQRDRVLRVEFENGARVRLSPQHMMKCGDGEPMEAAAVRVGDSCAVLAADKQTLVRSVVRAVHAERAASLVVAPVTSSGYVIADDVALSSFAAFDTVFGLRLGHRLISTLIPAAQAVEYVLPGFWNSDIGASFAHYFVTGVVDLFHPQVLSKLNSYVFAQNVVSF